MDTEEGERMLGDVVEKTQRRRWGRQGRAGGVKS